MYSKVYVAKVNASIIFSCKF